MNIQNGHIAQVREMVRRSRFGADTGLSRRSAIIKDKNLVVLMHAIVSGDLRCPTLPVAGITTRSVVQLSSPTPVFRLNEVLVR